MAINNPRLSFKTPAPTRQEAKIVAVKIISSVPGEVRRYVDDGVLKQETTEPEWEGQIIFQKISGTQGEATMYVSVEIGGELFWKRTDNGSEYFDSRTGRPWDPKAGFYNPLVPLS
jgi:hypothetical protein